MIDQEAYYKMIRKLDTFNLAKTISDMIMGNFKQNAKIVIVGETGAGKSYAALSLAEDIAKHNSIKKYGNIKHSKEYFNPDENIAVIDPDSIKLLFKKAIKKHNIYVIDDAAYAWSNRKWMTKQNEILNAWFGMMRTYETCIIITVQSDKFIDAQARALFNFYVEMSGPHLYDYEVNYGKVFITSLQPRSHKPVHTYYPRRNHGRDIYTLCGFISPSEEIVKHYNKIRDENLQKFGDQGFEQIEKWIEMKEKTESKVLRRETKKDIAFKWLDEAAEKNMEISAKALSAAIPSIPYGTAKCYLSEWRAIRRW